MPVMYPPEHPISIEMAKWNKPYRFEPFPKMLYRAQRRPDGIWSAGESEDRFFGGHPGAAEQWTRGCQRIVRNEDEMLKLKGQGWAETPDQALEVCRREQDEISHQAAHRAFEDRLLSDAARLEASKAEEDSFDHVPEIPEKRRPGRPRKVQA